MRKEPGRVGREAHSRVGRGSYGQQEGSIHKRWTAVQTIGMCSRSYKFERAQHVRDGLQYNPLACAAGVTLRENNLKELEGGLITGIKGALVANKRA